MSDPTNNGVGPGGLDEALGLATRIGRRGPVVDRGAVAKALNQLESVRPRDATARADLVDAVYALPHERCQIIGLTGPPGVGKSTLAGRIIGHWRRAGLRVGIIAVDPSSKVSGGAVLGDRARMGLDGRDPDVFMRSMAARDQLGGLAPATFDALCVMRAAFDRVLIETVGVGQSETDVSSACDITVVVMQPASGDTLQFIKAGLMEVFDILAVNKSDLGDIATRTRADLYQALGPLGRKRTPVLLTSGETGDGVEALLAAASNLHDQVGDWSARRRAQWREHTIRRVTQLYGTLWLAKLGGIQAAMARLEALDDDATPTTLLEAITPARLDFSPL